MTCLKKRFLASALMALGCLFSLPFVTFAATVSTHAEAPQPFCNQLLPYAHFPEYSHGWVITAHESDPHQCGVDLLAHGNIAIIAPAPTSMTSTICADSPMPVGFFVTGTTRDPNCDTSYWDALTGAGKRLAIAQKVPSQLAGHDPTTTGCNAHLNIVSSANILDGQGKREGSVFLLQSMDCGTMYYSMVTSDTAQSLLTSIENVGIMDGPPSYSSSTPSSQTLFSPLLPPASGSTCAYGTIGQDRASTCTPSGGQERV